MSLAELCKSTAKKAKERERSEARKPMVEDIIKQPEKEIKPKPRIGPHTPPLPREPSSPRITPEPSSTADFSQSYFKDDRDARYKHHHHHHHRKRYETLSRSQSPVDSYRSHAASRSYSAGSSRLYAHATSTTTSSGALPVYSTHVNSRTISARYREDSEDRERHQSVTGTRTISPPPLAEKRPQKVPYYSDEKRERDRLRRKYGDAYASASSPKRARSSTDKSAYYADDKREKERHRRLYAEAYAERSLSRSKSPTLHNVIRRRSSGPDMHHSDRYHSMSPLSERRGLHRRRSMSRSRSRSLERRLALARPPTQIITIPVAVPPDYPYAFTSWPPQWGAPFPLNSLLPPSSLPPLRPPYGMPPYNPGMFRPLTRPFCPRPPRGPFSYTRLP